MMINNNFFLVRAAAAARAARRVDAHPRGRLQCGPAHGRRTAHCSAARGASRLKANMRAANAAPPPRLRPVAAKARAFPMTLQKK
jgi:hypothetical protein